MSLSAAWIFSRTFWPRSTTSSRCLAASWFSTSSRRKLCVCNSCELSSFGNDSINVSMSFAHLIGKNKQQLIRLAFGSVSVWRRALTLRSNSRRAAHNLLVSFVEDVEHRFFRNREIYSELSIAEVYRCYCRNVPLAVDGRKSNEFSIISKKSNVKLVHLRDSLCLEVELNDLAFLLWIFFVGNSVFLLVENKS